MAEIYFEGVDLSQPPKPFHEFQPIEIIEMHPPISLASPREVIEIQVFPFDLEEIPELAQIEPEYDWDFNQVLVSFSNVLNRIEHTLGVNLPIENRLFVLVDKKDLLPEREEDRQRLAERYGPYILNGIAGDCERLNEGEGFLIRIGYKGREGATSNIDVLETIAHEYGHSLGEEFLADPELEELKAEAFCSLFMRFYYDVDYYGGNPYDLSEEKAHDMAIHKFNLLMVQGISEEEILAHLTRTNFGKHKPTDYLEHSRNTRTE